MGVKPSLDIKRHKLVIATHRPRRTASLRHEIASGQRGGVVILAFIQTLGQLHTGVRPSVQGR
jgi:hypothetical protein